MTERNTRIRASQIRSIYPIDMESTNAKVDGYIPSYDEATGKFTWISTNEDVQDRNELNIVLNAFRIAINGSLSYFNMIDGVVDEYEDETGIDTGASINENYDSSNDLYQPDSLSGGIDANTKLMLHGNGTDGSISHPISLAGTAQLDTAQKEFGVSSLLLDGNSDYVTIPDSNDWNFASTDFAIDMWVRFNTAGTTYFYNQRLNSVDKVSFYLSGGYLRFETRVGSVAKADMSRAWSPSTDTWYHIAVTRSGNTYRLFVDGTKLGSDYSESTAIPDIATQLEIGYSVYAGDGYLDGWLDEYRVSKGQARWTSNFTPETSEYDADAWTCVLLHFDGTDAITSTNDSAGGDVSVSDHTITYNANAQLDTAQYKFENCSILFDGTGDYVSAPDSDDWNFGSGNFTIDLWTRFNTLPSNGTYMGLVSQYVDSNNYWTFRIYNNGGTYQLNFSQKETSETIAFSKDSPGLSTGTWYHFTVVRSGNDWLMFQDGTQTGTTGSDSTAIADISAVLKVGDWNDTNSYLNGWVDEVRVSKGVARWTSNFTPETSEYTSITAVLNMTLISVATVAEAIPSNGRIVIFEEDVDSITINTDLKAYVSRDDGSTWAEATLIDVGDYESGKRVLTSNLDFTASGIGSGTNMKYKLVSFNEKEFKIHGVGELWD